MGILRKLFGRPDPSDVFRMPNNPRDFIGGLGRRKFWRRIDSSILFCVARNAAGEMELLRNFVFVSERFRLVESNFARLANSPDPLFGSQLSGFALTLYRLGSALCKQRISARSEEQAKSAVMFADMAFTSAVLCDPLFLEAYAGMAFLYGGEYGTLNRQVALEWCQKYKEAERRLLATPDEQLNPFQQAAKRGIEDPEEDRRTREEIAMYAPHLLEPTTEDRPIRQLIEKLEGRLMGS